MTDRKFIETRVCIDDDFGPFDCKLNPENRWNGWLSPYFTLDTTRELSAQTLRMADEYGYDCVSTIHVIDGFEDSRDTVHIIEGGLNRDSDDGEPNTIAVRIRWRNVGRDAVAAVSFSSATPKDRKAARRRKATGHGARRTVVVHVRWQWLHEGGDIPANVVPLSRDGLYGIGGWEWTWHFAGWWCACGADWDWHETTCTNCDLTRDTQPGKKPCDCGCDPEQGVTGEYDLESEASRAHLARTGRYLRWSESDAQPTL
ncbi:hypothetical protein ACIQZB_00335 [Streptomyces sp. NPDC097727]|uniref:hypothetical protein n=1 Tax=Streptomyces sp. NPDC097727 TaxID=3366092 RepID=UPI0037F129A4